MKKLIDCYMYSDSGFIPLHKTTEWQVAKLNYQIENSFYNILKMDIHHNTDEIFILINGRAVLIAATLTDTDCHFEPVLMKIGFVYNIPKNCWHNIMLSEDAEIIIVENSNTHLGDFEFYDLTLDQREVLNKQVMRLNDV